MTIGPLNVILNRYNATVTFDVPRAMVNGGDELLFTLMAEAPTGSPTGLVITPVFKLATAIHKGFNIVAESNGNQKPYISASEASGPFKGLLPDGDWVALGTSSTLPTDAAPFIDSRRLIVPAGVKFVRLGLTLAFTGGTAPAVPISVFFQQKVN